VPSVKPTGSDTYNHVAVKYSCGPQYQLSCKSWAVEECDSIIAGRRDSEGELRFNAAMSQSPSSC
jgi:hypothetical protein